MVGDTVKFSYRITNPGPTKTRPLAYRAYTFILKGGEKLPADGGRQATYGQSWTASGVGCGGRGVGSNQTRKCQQESRASGSNLVVNTVNGFAKTDIAYTINNDWMASPGDKICSYIAVDSNWQVTDDKLANTYAASQIACATVGKQPQIQITGSDSYAKDGFQGSSTRVSSLAGYQARGSYSQYGLLTGDNKVENFGSAGYTVLGDSSKACTLAWANTATTKTDCKINTLSPARLTKTLSTPLTASSTSTINSPLNLATLTSGTYQYTGTELQVYGQPSKGAKLTIVASDRIKITGNTGIDRGAANYQVVTDLPSLTIVAGNNILVDGSVTNIYGNYISTNGRFNSCADSREQDWGIIDTKCNRKLEINGAVVTGNGLQLYRIFGSGNVDGVNQTDTNRISTTSEWFNYTPNLWLRDNTGRTKVTGYTITSVSTLPVRY